MFASDQGPDQRAVESMVRTALKPFLLRLHFRQWCGQHSIHLICKRQLKLAEPHFGNCAKIVHCWRSSALRKRIAAAWSERFGEERAKVVCSRLPMRALRGRWGSMFECERDLLRAGEGELPAAFQDAVVARQSRSARAGEPQDSNVGYKVTGFGLLHTHFVEVGIGQLAILFSQCKQLALQKQLALNIAMCQRSRRASARARPKQDMPVLDEDDESFAERASRWGRESIEALRSGLFWIVMHIVHASARP
eukprot:6960391-Alexandrium_andersonii.AAC.1